MRRRALFTRTAIALLTTSALALAGCGSSGPGASDEVQVWALQDAGLTPVVKASVDRYNKDSDNEATLSTYINDAYKQKIQVAMGSPNAPDVFFNWGGGNLAQFVDADQVEPLDDALAKKPEVRDAFLTNVMDTAKIDGKQYGLPMTGTQPVIFFYNKAVFTANNVQPPTTYPEFLKLVDTFKSKKVTPIALPGSQGWTELMYAEYFLDRLGGPEKFAAIAKSGGAAWQDPAVVKAFQMCQDLAKMGAFGTNFASINYDNAGASKLLATGKAAMFLMGTWEYPNQLTNNPAFAKKDLGWFQFPSIPGGVGEPGNLVGNPSNYFSVASGSKNKDAAVDYLTETVASDGYIEDLIKSGAVPATKGADAKLAGKPNAEFNTDVYKMVSTAPAFAQSWDQAVAPDVAKRLLANLQKLFLQQITPQAFADDMAKAQ
ncbi:ABC transporter substrate-binding protein [Cryptosporangium aurantiacum]|uniref:Carbohydrate ABC transporter substrate-binding protein, CUT1 family n=1 Tax=Cryptosporangium aurantiacum TaxID=134849 RepID=A0A1M7HNZ0_9ACTN|nr:extracellular solute-binding protein [Cryptosporangium aurantiacum]SHM30108.1 carbohydrate ABC transporter substrate-binding protein, CUT1 family [Cryptosporangium aurantiacum]